MKDFIVRFLMGGFIVSAFSLLSDILKPKTFAGLFGAAPSVALASLGLTILMQGKSIATMEARSMIVGGVALLLYAWAVSYVLLRFRLAALVASLSALLLWLVAAVGLWYAVLIS